MAKEMLHGPRYPHRPKISLCLSLSLFSSLSLFPLLIIDETVLLGIDTLVIKGNRYPNEFTYSMLP
jgi:hypothetical protein